MERYVAYYRVSTKKQGESGLGLEAQVRMVQGYARNGSIVEEFTEKETGTSKRERPILAEAIEMCKETGAKLLIAKLDRLARDVHFISSLSRTGVDFICCDNPNANKLTINLLASVAESEAEAISARTKAGLASIKERIRKDGMYLSRSGRNITSLGTPENLTDEGRRKSGEVIKQRFKNNRNTRMARPYASELKDKGLELIEIADKLNSNGFITATGRQFNKFSVYRLMK
jgi:DNA invertase Pin-like site-specific DNA recombinase